jgi:serine protease
VASVGPLRIRAPYSNFGASVDLAAPGGDMRFDINGDGQPDGVYSTHASGGGSNTTPNLEQLQGTSMAAPHVSGVIALMLSANPATTPAQIDLLLAQGALTDDIGVPGPDELGAGLINARKAIAAVDPSLPPAPPMLSVTPSSLAFGDIGTTAEVFATNAGGGTLTGVTVSAVSEPWLSATATSVDANGVGLYRVSVDRTGLADGSYSGFVTFASDNGGTVRVDVIMEVAPITGEPNAGMQYILLIDVVTDEPIAQVEVLADGSSVAYQFDAVPAGEYILLSGTDLNNDGFICDPGEACGAYPVENAPVPIVVGDGVVDGVDFLVAYRTGVPTSTGSKSASKDVRPVTRHRRIIH